MTGARPVAIVTGGSGGIAPAIARALVDLDHVVVLTARRAGPLQQVAARFAEGQAVTITSDATDAASVGKLADTVTARFGRIDILINAAASTNPIGGAIEQVDVGAVIGDLDTKVGGYLRYIQAVVPVMKARRHGRIVNIGGLTGRSSDTLNGLRNAAVAHLTKVLADQLGPSGITVNAVHPGIVHTPHLEDLFADMARQRDLTAAAVESEFIARIPLRRILRPEDIGETVAFLAGPAGASITGESIAVDGGFSRGIYL